MLFFMWGMLMLFFILMVLLVGNRHEGEEERNGHNNQFYAHEEGLEVDKGKDNEGRSKTY